MQDILLDIDQHDIRLANKINAPILFESVWGNILAGDNSSVVYLNIIVPQDYASLIAYDKERRIIVDANVPYNAEAQSFVVRLVTKTGAVYRLFAPTKLTLASSYPAKSYLGDWLSARSIKASELPAINIDGRFRIALQGSYAYVYSCSYSDFDVSISEDQEAQLLALCHPGNLYRTPFTGVGAIRFVNGIIEHTDLSQLIVNQYAVDNKEVYEANYNSINGQLQVKFTAGRTYQDATVNQDVDSSLFDLNDQDLKNLIIGVEDYSIVWPNGNEFNVQYTGVVQTYQCSPVISGGVNGDFTYAITSGSNYATVGASNGLVTFSTTKAGGDVVVRVTFTPSDVNYTGAITSNIRFHYEKATPVLKFVNSIPDYVEQNENISFAATTNSNGAITYKVDGHVVASPSFTATSLGTHTISASTQETDVYKAAEISRTVTAVSSDAAVPYIYTGTSTAYNAKPQTVQEIQDGISYSDYRNIVFNTKNKGLRTIWIAVPDGHNINFNGVIYDPEGDSTQMSSVKVGGYTVWYWTQMIVMTTVFRTVTTI